MPEKVQAQDIPLEPITVVLADTITVEPVLPLPPVIVESQYQKELRESEEALPDVLKRIRQCESHSNYQAENSRSTASGAFQATDSTFNNFQGYARAKDAPKYIQNQFALELYQKRGTSPWLASAKCWSSSRSNSNVQTVSSQSGVNTCSCVLFIKQKYGIDPGSVGAARNWPINSQEPRVGAVVVTRESSLGHVAYITAIKGDFIVLDEAHFGPCGEKIGRQLPINSPLIKGYYAV